MLIRSHLARGNWSESDGASHSFYKASIFQHMTSHWHSRDRATTSLPYFICLESAPLIFNYLVFFNCYWTEPQTAGINPEGESMQFESKNNTACGLRRDHLLGLVFPTKTSRQDGLICTTIWTLMLDPPQETKGRERERDGSVSEDQH
jgi:hypothetical protein